MSKPEAAVAMRLRSYGARQKTTAIGGGSQTELWLENTVPVAMHQTISPVNPRACGVVIKRAKRP